MREERRKEYFTRKLALAAFLMAKGMRLIRIDGIGNRRMFVFRDIQQRPFLEKKFFNHTATVNVTRFEQCRKAILNFKENIDLNKNEGNAYDGKTPLVGKEARQKRTL